ncbi:hypothetical protein [Nonomuraea sp. NPDC049158]|uniref:hypothetical protein n=1 Tax=Nonomuraea sp. NPDC049158 TaxID=3155649 RepID=UPI0033D42296
MPENVEIDEQIAAAGAMAPGLVVIESLTCGEPVSLTTGHTTMAGLNCGTRSSIAWPYLRRGLDAAVAITDAAAARAAGDLVELGVSAGPCGATDH